MVFIRHLLTLVGYAWACAEQIGSLKEVLEKDGRKMKNSKMAILTGVESYIRELEGQISDMSITRQRVRTHGHRRRRKRRRRRRRRL